MLSVNGISEQRLRREKRDYVVNANTALYRKGIIVNISGVSVAICNRQTSPGRMSNILGALDRLILGRVWNLDSGRRVS